MIFLHAKYIVLCMGAIERSSTFAKALLREQNEKMALRLNVEPNVLGFLPYATLIS